MLQIGKTYVCEDAQGSWSFTVLDKCEEGLIIDYNDKTNICSEAELLLCNPVLEETDGGHRELCKSDEYIAKKSDEDLVDELEKKVHKEIKGEGTQVNNDDEKTPEEKEKDEEVNTGSVENGLKVQYGAVVKPVYPKTRLHEELLSSIGAYKEIASISEDKFVEYNSYTKVATLYEEGQATSKMRVTNTDWEFFSDAVVAQMGGNNGCTD